MTHERRTLSAVFMAVVLILASGTAVSLAVTDSSSSDVGANAPAVQNETTTEDGVEMTTVEDGVETTEADDDGAAGNEGQAVSVTIDEQESDGERVVIESVTMDEGGFIAIHDSSYENVTVGSVLGNSVYLEAGTHENVEITLARPIEEGQTLVAMPHYDTNDNQVYDFVLSTGELDGPYTVDGEVVVDSANVSLEGEDTTTTTEEEVANTTTTEDEVVEMTTTEEDDLVETTTEDEEVVETTTTEEDDLVETTTEEEDGIVETTTTEMDDVEQPTDEQQVVFKVEQMQIDEWSFVVGDEEEPDRTEVVSDLNVQDRRVEINLTEMLQEQKQMAERQTMTTMDPEEAREQLEENLSQDLETVRIVIRNVNVENVTLVVTAPEGMELPEPPMTTTTEDEEIVETTTEDEEVVEATTTEEDDLVENTTEEDEFEETTTEDEEVVETTTEEDDLVETTTEDEEVVETTTTEEDEVEETTTEGVDSEAELDSFDVSNLDAPETASVGDTITVSATVSNPNDQEATQEVAFRLDGTVVQRQSVTLDANAQETVTFEVDTTNVPAGQYIHGVYTQDFGELAVIALEEPTEEGETGDDTGNETGDEETTVGVETTTADGEV